ncbi:hypothetical protein GCM10007973_23390 [Polymorphobacter multimanifer]|uniref:Capsular polysaccharide export protein n=1 Tax=Polymorphobacter multimanifer TaxID=1070431 RepID=A0A841LGI2_9SPHN|nr:hypothetical protein [Polymorphobacter multimanifer]MBB6228302.1 capsular polysaccharide export protein [Polymorphobacter multimanifer]GGI86176.1 hypothetical protein GCM10007973_23390 [Polymorphobacter multimanifer]
MTSPTAPLLAIPPFPGARRPCFAVPAEAGVVDVQSILSQLAAARVGGCYWGARPVLPPQPFVLDGHAVPAAGSQPWPADADPWHMLAGAEEVRLPDDDPRIVLAVAAGRPLRIGSRERQAGADEVARLVADHFASWRWIDPFSGEAITLEAAIALAGFWRQAIDTNRPITAAMGFAYWKKPTVAPLLWGGQPVDFARTLPAGGEQAVAIWRARLSTSQARALERERPRLLEVEDGFIRSAGLGADCVPPLSIIVDGEGVHFDPRRPSGLEQLLQAGNFPPALLARAARLREAIVAHGLSKYARGEAVPLPRPGGARLHVLVPGQVEDDRAVTSGGALASNLELLRRARAEAGPDAWLIYKPHPDVLAGHRRGHVPAADMAALANEVATHTPIADLITMVDALHVNSSLAGFEALLRGKAVTVHGVPFYAGCGLTTDRGPVPPRRTARRSLDELVAAALILYPRYLDPETGIPCPAEVLVQRLSAGSDRINGNATVIAARRLQGRVRRSFSGLKAS